MALENGNGVGMYMPMQPAGGYGNGGFGYGGDLSGLIVLFLFAAMFGGFGNGFGGGNGANGMFPWLMAGNTNSDALMQTGFNQAATAAQLQGIQSSITAGFGNAEVANCNRAMDAMQTSYNNQIASMNQSFANAQALDARLDAMAMAQQNCCCENRAGIADLKYTVATEACADRNAISLALKDVLTAQTAGIQSIKDQLCDLRDAEKNDRIRTLEQQLNMATLAASQAAQTQQIVSQVRPQIDPAYIVPNPYAYNFMPSNGWYQGGNCGCGCGNM